MTIAAGRFVQILKSPVTRDIEVRRFIESRLTTMSPADIRKECKARFGGKRTPSEKAIQRFKRQFNGLPEAVSTGVLGEVARHLVRGSR